MTSTLARLLCAALLLSLGGCLNSTTTITVKKDGSGTIEERSLAGAEFVKMMDQFSQGLGQLLGKEAASKTSSNPILQSDDTYRRKAASFGEGVAFVSAAEATEKDGGRGALVRYRFDDISRLAIQPQQTMSALDSLKAAIPIQVNGQSPLPGSFDAGDPVTFGFEPGDVATLTVKLPKPDEEKMRKAAAEAAKARTPDPAELAQARQYLADLGFALVLAVDGEVVSSNATHREGSSMTLFEMNFGEILEDPEAFAKFQRLGNEKDFDKVKESFQDVEGMKFETGETVEIRFK